MESKELKYELLLGMGTDFKAKLFLKVYLELDILTSYLF